MTYMFDDMPTEGEETEVPAMPVETTDDPAPAGDDAAM